MNNFVLIYGIIAMSSLTFSSAYAVQATMTCKTQSPSQVVANSIFHEPKIIRIENKDNFRVCMAAFKEGSGSISSGLVSMAKTVQQQHKTYLNTFINVDDRSIAIEIAGHYYPQKFAKYLPNWLYQKLASHTEMIDIGEKDVDDNRIVWDGLVSIYDLITSPLEMGIQLSPWEEQVAESMRRDLENGEMDSDLLEILSLK